MQLLSAVLVLGASRLEVTVLDSDGHRRRVTFTWSTRERSDVPPAHWPEAVAGEVEFQRTQDYEEARGRLIPR